MRDDPNESISKNSAVCRPGRCIFQNANQEKIAMSKSHSRRAVLAGIATAPALAAPALALSGPDPIFAAIERHKATYVALGLSEEGAVDAAVDAETDASRKMAATVPTTLAGLLALLRYVEKMHNGDGGEEMLDEDGLVELVSTTISALERIGAVS
jgi:hypothetical protein